MKLIKKFLIFMLPMFILVGCADLDLQPTDMISEDAVKKDPKLVEAFLTKIMLMLFLSQTKLVIFHNKID